MAQAEEKTDRLSGYLRKKSPKSILGKHPWQKRWFVIQDMANGARMVYFKASDKTNEEPLGIIPLDRVVKVELMAHKEGRFNVHVEGNRVFALWANSTAEAQKWIANISNLRSNRRQSMIPLEKSVDKFWKPEHGAAASAVAASSLNSTTAAPDTPSNSDNSEKNSSQDGATPPSSGPDGERKRSATSVRRPSMVKCQGFLTKAIQSKDGQKSKGSSGRFWCRVTQHTLFFHQPDMANREDAVAVGYLSLKDIVNSDFKETNSWFLLETRDEVWTLSVSDSEKRASVESKEAGGAAEEATRSKAKAWYQSICRYLIDQPRDISEVLRKAEEEIRKRQEAKLKDAEGITKVNSTSAVAIDIDSSKQPKPKKWCCGCF